MLDNVWVDYAMLVRVHLWVDQLLFYVRMDGFKSGSVNFLNV